MEQEGLFDFKALRAKFQEELCMNPPNPRLTKPKCLPCAGAGVSLLKMETENQSLLRDKDGRKGATVRRPISYPLPLPPCTPPLFSTRDGDWGDSLRHSKDKRSSMVLPVLPKLPFSTHSSPDKSKKSLLQPFHSNMLLKLGRLSPESKEPSHASSSPKSEKVKPISPHKHNIAVSPPWSPQPGQMVSVISATEKIWKGSSSGTSSDGSMSPIQLEASNNQFNDEALEPSAGHFSTAITAAVNCSTSNQEEQEEMGALCPRAISVPPKIPLPDIVSLGPKHDKPARPAHVDLRPYLAKQANFGYAGEPKDSVLEDSTGVHVAFSHSDTSFPELHVNVGSQSVCSGAALSSDSIQVELIPPDFKVPEPPDSESSVYEIPRGQPDASLEANKDVSQSADDNLYEDVETVSKFRQSRNSRKHKVIPKNPYADALPLIEDGRRWFQQTWNSATADTFFAERGGRRGSPDSHEYKEQKKREKQRMEKERKEQKEREKKENEMRKKFNVTGQEEPMYQARVAVGSKGRKHDLPVKRGDIVSIIRTTDCPKGKWLARDDTNIYGYISVMNVELDIKEMLELGKKATQAAGRAAADGDSISEERRSATQLNVALNSSFTDDSEEWTGEEETLSPPSESRPGTQAALEPEMLFTATRVDCSVGDGNTEDEHVLAKHMAIQKLTTFFQQQEDGLKTALNGHPTLDKSEEQPPWLCPVEEQQPSFAEQDSGPQLMDTVILPPPEQYADSG